MGKMTKSLFKMANGCKIKMHAIQWGPFDLVQYAFYGVKWLNLEAFYDNF